MDRATAGREYVAYWDGSFQPSGAGIGLQIFCGTELLVSCSIPVVAGDATRCEALGPPLLALLLSLLPMGSVVMHGDSLFVCNHLNYVRKPQDVWIFNCCQLFYDLMRSHDV